MRILFFEDMPFPKAHLPVATALFMAFVIESREQLALVYVSGSLGTAFGIDEGANDWALSAPALGMIPGSLVWATLALATSQTPPAGSAASPSAARRAAAVSRAV
ncbi:hypothetical protein [Streptomyces sp. NPDC002463]|uniref:hypothetical protein n=1 Tax=Streptomyces sp. NPDC002463 TaxID=3364645 RepID=UPI00369B41BE